jgi:hypothetical protein
VEQVLPRSRGGGVGTMYAHVSKCKNDKMKERNRRHDFTRILLSVLIKKEAQITSKCSWQVYFRIYYQI